MQNVQSYGSPGTSLKTTDLECSAYNLSALTGHSKLGPCSPSTIGRANREITWVLNGAESTLGT